MIAITENKLIITITDSEPMEKRDCLIRAIAAAIRWKASEENPYRNDGENQYTLAQLLEELLD